MTVRIGEIGAEKSAPTVEKVEEVAATPKTTKPTTKRTTKK